MLFQSHCAGCERPGSALCRTCRFALAAPAHLPVDSDVVAAVAFSGRARRVLLGLKYGNRRTVVGHLAGLLATRLNELGVADAVDVVTWAPTSNSRRRRRGFDQSEYIARAVAARLGLPCRRLLRREGAAPAQTQLGRAQRLHGPTFTARPDVEGKRVLVIDDVVTTGSTLRSAAAALGRAGAHSVERAAVANTPALEAPRALIRRRPRRDVFESAA